MISVDMADECISDGLAHEVMLTSIANGSERAKLVLARLILARLSIPTETAAKNVYLVSMVTR